MNVLEKIILVQYFVCEAEEIHLDGHTAFLGPNGTGKSALLDAIQIAMMGADLNNIRFNVKSSVKDGRSLRDYCLGFYRPPEAAANTTAKPQRCRDTAHTYITLVFRNETTGERVSAGVAINASIRDERHKLRGHYVARGVDLSLDDHLQASGDDKAPLPWREFEAALREKCARLGITSGVIHDGSHAYVSELLHALQPANVVVDPDEFRKAFKKSLALRDMENVNDLVRTFVIPEQSIDRHRAVAQVTKFRDLERIVRDTEIEIAQLADCEASYERLQGAARRGACYEALQRIFETEGLQDDISVASDEIERLELDGAGISDTIHELKQASANANARLVEHKTLMGSTESSQALHGKIGQLDVARRAAVNHDARYRAILTSQFGLIAKVKTYAGVPEAVRRDLKALEARYIRQSGPGAPVTPDGYRAMIGEAAALLREAHKAIKPLSSAVAKNSEEADKAVADIRAQITQAEAGGAPLDPASAGALEAFYRANIDARPVSALVRVSDPAWQPAIEAYLGGRCFSFLMPSATDERAALSLARNPSSRLNGVKIIRVAHIPSEYYADPAAGLVSGLLQSDDRDALAYLRMQCGRLRMMRSDADLDDIPMGLSVDGVLNKSASSQPLRLPPPGKLCLGRTSSAEDLRSLRAELSQWEQKANELHRSKEQLDKLNSSCIIHSDAEQIAAQVEAIAKQRLDSDRDIATISDQIAGLETGAAGELSRQLAELNAEAEKAAALLSDAVAKDGVRATQLSAARAKLDGLDAKVAQARVAESSARAADDYDEGRAYQIRETVESKYSSTPDSERSSEMIRFCSDRARAEQNQVAELKVGARSKLFDFLQTRQHDALDLLGEWHKAFAWVAGRRKALADTTLADNKAVAAEARSAAEEAFRRDVVFKLQDGIAGMRQTIRQINNILMNCPPFSNGETYRFSAQVTRIYSDLHDYIVNSSSSDQGDMFNEGGELAGRIMDYLAPADGGAPLAVNPLEDFRLLFDFDLDIYVDNVKSSSLSRRMGLGSNGEHLCPFHVIVAVALAHAYRLDERRSTGGLGLMMLDEAFNAMDDQNALAAAKFITGLGLQLIMAGPSSDCGKLSSFTRTIYELDRWDDKLEFHREELTEDAHALLQSDMPAMNPDKVLARAQEIANASA